MIDPIELHALADGELTAIAAAELKRRLAASPADQAHYESIVALKKSLGRLTVIECRTEWKGCVKRLNEMDRSRRVEHFASRYAWALCGVFFVAIVAGGTLSRNKLRDTVTMADFSRIATTIAPMQTPPKDIQRERWLDNLLGQARQSVDPRRMKILGYANGHLDGRPVTTFALRDATGTFSLLVLPGSASLEGDSQLEAAKGFKLGHLMGVNCVAWTDGRNTFAAVADRSFEELVQVATNVSQPAPAP